MKKRLFTYLLVCMLIVVLQNTFAAVHIFSRNVFVRSAAADTTTSRLHLRLNKDSLDYAQTGIFFRSTASDLFVAKEDSLQTGNTADVSLSSYSSDDVNLSVNTLSSYTAGKRVRLYVNAAVTGVYTLSLADIADFDTVNYNIYLVDNQKQDSLDIVHYKTYIFNLNTGDSTSFGANRFVLAVEHKPVPQYILAAFSGQKVSTGIQLNWTAVNAGNYTKFTLQKMNSSGGYDSLYAVQSDTGTTMYTYIDTNPITGDNVYRLKQTGLNGIVTCSAAITVGYNSASSVGALTLYPNPASSTLNATIASGTIRTPAYEVKIFNSIGSLVKDETVSGITWTDDVSSYKHVLYVMQVKDTNGFIIAQAKFLKVK